MRSPKSQPSRKERFFIALIIIFAVFGGALIHHLVCWSLNEPSGMLERFMSLLSPVSTSHARGFPFFPLVAQKERPMVMVEFLAIYILLIFEISRHFLIAPMQQGIHDLQQEVDHKEQVARTLRRHKRNIQIHEGIYRRIVQASPAGMHMWEMDNGDLVLTGFNPAADAILGFDTSQKIGLEITQVFPNLAITEIPQRFTEIALNGGKWSSTQISTHTHQKEFYVQAFQVASGCMVASFVDISDQKKAEAEIQRREEFIRATLDALPNHIAVVDRDGTIVQTNLAWNQFAVRNGIQDPGSVGEGNNYFTVCSQAGGEEAFQGSRCLTGMQDVLDGKHSFFTMEYPCHSPDQERWFQMWVTPFPRQNKAVVSHLDITERVVAENTAADAGAARQAAELASQAKSDFLSTMSHELRTPLHGIRGSAQTLQRWQRKGRLSTERIDNYLKDILNSANHMTEMIDDLLDLSKIEAGRMEIKLEAVNVPQVLADMESNLASWVRDKGLSFQFDVPCHVPLVRADKKRLTQIIFNLIGNAVKFTDQGFVQVSVSRAGGRDAYVQLEVRDSGIGVAAEDREKIFDRFAMVDTSGKQKGTGLGLAIVKKLVEMMGGRIWVESELGKGSTFIFQLLAHGGTLNSADSQNFPDTGAAKAEREHA